MLSQLARHTSIASFGMVALRPVARDESLVLQRSLHLFLGENDDAAILRRRLRR